MLLGALLRLPNVETPFDKLLNDLPSRIAISVFGITLGPVIEELLFRGFLQPVLVDSFGALPDIGASVVFGAMHLMQNAIFGRAACSSRWWDSCWAWCAMFGSTRASAITHVSYNALPFVLMRSAKGNDRERLLDRRGRRHDRPDELPSEEIWVTCRNYKKWPRRSGRWLFAARRHRRGGGMGMALGVYSADGRRSRRSWGHLRNSGVDASHGGQSVLGH